MCLISEFANSFLSRHVITLQEKCNVNFLKNNQQYGSNFNLKIEETINKVQCFCILIESSGKRGEHIVEIKKSM